MDYNGIGLNCWIRDLRQLLVSCSEHFNNNHIVSCTLVVFSGIGDGKEWNLNVNVGSCRHYKFPSATETQRKLFLDMDPHYWVTLVNLVDLDNWVRL